MQDILNKLWTALTPEQWTGAFLGTFVSALFTVFITLFNSLNRYILGKRYSKKVLEATADDKTECLISLREMQNYNDDGRYRSYGPKIHPAISQDIYEWQNIRSVLGDEDVQAIGVIYNLLGEVGKTSNITLNDVSKTWNNWTTPQFSIGGNYKTYELIKKCTPILIRYENQSTFEVLESGKKYSNYENEIGNYDIGIV